MLTKAKYHIQYSYHNCLTEPNTGTLNTNIYSFVYHDKSQCYQQHSFVALVALMGLVWPPPSPQVF
jgi:hypothetical protein